MARKTLPSKTKTKEYNATWYKKNGDKIKTRRIFLHREARQYVIDRYGGICACCGEHRYEFLCFDHKDNGRGNPAKRLKHGGNGIWPLLVKEDYPDYIQILCHNCNMAKGNHGICPHIQERIILKQMHNEQ